MIWLRWILVAAIATVPAGASTYFPEQKVCPVGGEAFQFRSLGSITRWGALPDGMPTGSGYFPVQPPQCPGNGLILYRDFTPAEVKALDLLVGGPDYKALRAAGETSYYLAYRTAKVLGDPGLPWLLLNATWEAKNADPASDRTRRYNAEFVALVAAMPADGASFDSIALRARAANALRELGRFDEAEALRAAIVVAPTAGGEGEQARENREGWLAYLRLLAAPIARRDRDRAPIDMIGDREAVFRCTDGERAAEDNIDAPPLSAFEAAYCARPELAEQIAERRKMLRE
ncbi:MAG: hypothetical protein AB7E60_07330 [Sphingobium sp.]